MTAAGVLRALPESDQHVSVSEVEARWPGIGASLTALCDFVQELWPDRHCVFLAGSRAVALRAGQPDGNLVGAHSDVDVLVVLTDPHLPPGAALSPWAVRCGLLRDFDMVAVPWGPASAFSVKLVSLPAAVRSFTLANQHHLVLRMSSLIDRKPVDRYHGLRSVHAQRTIERAHPFGYVWRWESPVLIGEDLVLTDLVSFVSMGAFVVDHLGLAAMRRGFIAAFADEVQAREVDDQCGDLFGYLRSRSPDTLSTLHRAVCLR